MNLVIPVTFTFAIITSAVVRSDPDIERNHGDLKSEAARQKIYDIISSHEDRKYGDHGGHEYEEGEVPRRRSSRKSKSYRYLANEPKYYYVDQPQNSEIVYESKPNYGDKLYSVQPGYTASKEHYPVVETVYAPSKREYAPHDSAYVVSKKPDQEYISPEKNVYHDNVEYVEDKRAPITIGQTARTIYPSHSHYAAVDPKAPSEYLVLDGQKPPKPLILDPKLKATYHNSQPISHYSAPEHQVVLKPDVSVPVHYSAPVKEYASVKNYAPVKDYVQYDDYKTEDKGHHAYGHGHYSDNAVKKDSGHKSHGHHEVAGHKAHSSIAGHHDEHDHHHNRGLYERDRGYHYEKAYAYDRVRSHHDIGAKKGSHSTYGAHHGQEAHKDIGNHGAQTYSYFKKDDHGSGYGYGDENSLYKKGQNYYNQKYVPVYYHG